MGDLRSRPRAPLLLSLIVALQVPRSSAHPVDIHDSPQYIRTITEAESYIPPGTVTISCSTSTASNVVQQSQDGQVQIEATKSDNDPYPTNRVIVQIQDGQVQNPVITGEASSSSSSTSVLSARDVTTANPSGVPAGLPFTSLTTYLFAEQTSSFSITISDSALTSLTTSEVQTATESAPSSTSGSIVSSLESSGNPTLQPFPSSPVSASTSLSLVNTETVSEGVPSASVAPSAISASNIFQQISRDSPPEQIPVYDSHPMSRTGIQNQTHRLQTNKFYAGLYLGSQNTSSFLFPYSVTWARGQGELQSWGMGISHSERSQVAYAPFKTAVNGYRFDAGDWAYYASPLGVYSIIMSAAELNSTPTGDRPGLTTENQEWGAITANLFPHGWQTPVIQFPLLQGISFITGNYSWGTPLIQSGVGFEEVKYTGADANNDTFKYTALLNDSTTWLIYITPNRALSPDYPCESFTLNGSATDLQGHSGFNGLIQVAKLPGNSTASYSGPSPQDLYDGAAGAFATNVSISGKVDGNTGSYTLSWTKQGNPNQSLLMFALPHQIASLSSGTSSGVTGLHLMTTVKGLATAIRGDSWTLEESDLPVEVGFAPWKPSIGSIDSISTLSSDDKALISEIGLQELETDIGKATNLDSFYYAGKQFAKFATILWTQYQLVGNQSLVLTQLDPLKKALALWINGENQHPLVQETAWGGVISKAAYTDSNALADFGNGYYNDHHFHFGYFVYAAAVIAYLDPSWLDEGSNKAWINTLVRDYANPIVDDPLAPFSRAFDWYHGHSWAAGLFESADGKNQESSSEDTMSTYAIKMWGFVTKDHAMEARGNLMLAVQKRALNMYYLYDNTSTTPTQPPEFAGNKAAGILFENKIDHTTYFGALPEYIQGIHMIPTMPFSAYVRSPAFIQQEWEAYFGNFTSNTTTPSTTPYIESLDSGWRGILVADYCIANPDYGYNFFRQDGWRSEWLDGGASRTWYLAWCAALRAYS
ncbi:glycoside hydrolase family 81 protein [Zasmidium cellare ATCC 36951]|uniref:glucan endo-1,3-beta-D-glucosidase n=1 Tax=Zasmidium cellare ATCC 36951 TaxID=1080233 RepID=A0A6A6CAY7_ZASCE|nr:glycoside hydrolase family 81 protein [Zasmidium cellare ATCC 36951]KAF2162809.1 glycoside hydrolase family 81 protein [Zasmidium cellare ATCC 36951]